MEFKIDLTCLTLTQLADLFVTAFRVLPSVSHNGCESIFVEMINNAGLVDARAELKRRGIGDNMMDYYLYVINGMR